jgi:hypothetical protein
MIDKGGRRDVPYPYRISTVNRRIGFLVFALVAEDVGSGALGQEAVTPPTSPARRPGED